jgi:DNA-binding NarL/FixJ family response regulator
MPYAIAEPRPLSLVLEVDPGLGPYQSGAAVEERTTGVIHVLVADDDALARRMVRDALATDDVRVVGEARNGEEAVAMALQLAPDIVVMDLMMPGLDGIEAARRISTEAPETQIVMLSVSVDPEAILQALRAGAVGFLDKRIEVDALLRVVRGVHRGEAALDRLATRTLIQEFQAMSLRAEARRARATQSAGSTLSTREQEILELLADGCGTEAISDELGLALETVRTHIKAVLRKLRVHSRQEAIGVARERGILTAPGGPGGSASPRAGAGRARPCR